MRGIVLLAAGLTLAGCDFSQDPAANAAADAQAEQPLKLPAVLPTPQQELSRTALLEAVAQASSAFATGANDIVAQTALAGRRFTVRVRFGCEGPLEEMDERGLGWTYDEEEQRLQVRAAPNLIVEPEEPAATAGEGAAEAAGEEKPVEAVEGFWIPRPWILVDSCPVGVARDGRTAPAASPFPAPAAETRPTVGIAQYFTADESRVGRRSGRAYEATLRAPPDEVPSAEGFNLVLRGRLRAPPGDKVIRCSSTAPDLEPQCVISAEFDEISIENARTGAALGDWCAS